MATVLSFNCGKDISIKQAEKFRGVFDAVRLFCEETGAEPVDVLTQCLSDGLRALVGIERNRLELLGGIVFTRPRNRRAA